MNEYRISEVVKKFTEYDMILNHTDIPVFPDLRARLLSGFLTQGAGDEDKAKLYTVVASLVQLGLDTHETVPETSEAKEMVHARSRQMKVLAGDYFSSRYYQLLSRAGEVEAASQMAEAICEVNRLKISLHTRTMQYELTAEQYLELAVQIRVQLFVGFGRWMKGKAATLWPDILHSFSACEQALLEVERGETAAGFRFSWGFWKLYQSAGKEERKLLQLPGIDISRLKPLLLKYNIRHELYRLLEVHVAHARTLLQQVESQPLAAELAEIGEPFLRFAARPQVLEEI